MSTTLLLADDSVTIQRVIELTFAPEDVEVVAVGDGRQAVKWLETHVPDVLLADITVPGIDGYGLAEFVKQSDRLRHVPVLLLAGAFEPVDDDRVRALFCEGVLVKPFEPQQLVTRVRELLARPPVVDNESSEPAPLVQTPATADDDRPASADDDRPADVARALVAETGAGTVEPPVPTAPAHPGPEVESSVHVSLASVFAALLAAERSVASAPVPASVDSAAEPVDPAVEAAVRRVLVRMTDDLVRQMLTESASRLIKDEIAKIRTHPE